LTKTCWTAVLVLAALIAPACLTAAQLDPVHWSLTVEPLAAPPGSRVLAWLSAKIDPGWHLYSLSTPNGPIPTTVQVLDGSFVASFRVYQPRFNVRYDPNFELNTETFQDEVQFPVIVDLRSNAAAGEIELPIAVRYQACDDRQCLIPARRTLMARFTIEPRAAAARLDAPAGYSLFIPAAAVPAVSSGQQIEQAGEPSTAPPSTGEMRDLVTYALIAFGLGLAAIFTPCVFPMIPITVSFFLREDAGKPGRSVLRSFCFALGIVLWFSALGLLATALLGPFGASQLASSMWVNACLALLFLVFGLSLLGVFQISLPSGLVTRADRLSRRGGFLGSLLMALAFSLAAFSCVGPFVGSLLASSVTGGGMRPLIGMAAFACGLAVPFFGLSLFPGWLGKLPKSGDWMSRVKVILGFVILAAMLKYASNVDAILQWNILTRGRFIAVWMVFFGLAGLYLLGVVKLEGAAGKAGSGRIVLGLVFLAFALVLARGIGGGGLGELDAYIPLAAGRTAGWMRDDYQAALERGRAEGKHILLNFTGYTCTNCHWMKSNMFTRPEIAAALKEFILLDLYTDGTGPAAEANQKLLEGSYSTAAIPYYAIVDAEGKTVATFAGLTRKPEEFLAFLRSGRKPTE
jgi:thiol:disulfide interchange protein DsbD